MSEERRQMGAEVPRVERTEEVRPETEFPAAAEEQGEPGDSSGGCEGEQEEHGLSPRQNQPEVRWEGSDWSCFLLN